MNVASGIGFNLGSIGNFGFLNARLSGRRDHRTGQDHLGAEA
jgi:hypothetical protein